MSLYRIPRISCLMIAGLAFILAISNTVLAGGVGSSAAEFLNIAAGSRAAGFGGAYSSIANDPSACYWNPAGLIDIKSSSLMLQHNEYFQDLKHEYVAFASPMGNNGTLGFSISYLHMGSILGYDANDAPTGDFKAYDIAYGISYGHKINDNIGFGAGVKNVRQSIAETKASGWAFDAGFLYSFGNFNASLVAANFGPKIKYETDSFELPTEYRIGLSYSAEEWPVILSTEYGYGRDGSTRMALGAEYDLLNNFSIRSGYRPGNINDGDGSFAVGCGLNIWGQAIDYTFLPDADLGNSHRISATITFSEFKK